MLHRRPYRIGRINITGKLKCAAVLPALVAATAGSQLGCSRPVYPTVTKGDAEKVTVTGPWLGNIAALAAEAHSAKFKRFARWRSWEPYRFTYACVERRPT